RTGAERRAVLKPWAAHGRRPGGGKVHPRREGMKLEAVARQLGADAGEQASRRVVGEEGEEEQIPSPVADRLVARANRFGLTGGRRNDAHADAAVRAFVDDATAAGSVYAQRRGPGRVGGAGDARRADHAAARSEPAHAG